jgi:acyl carrier protein
MTTPSDNRKATIERVLMTALGVSSSDLTPDATLDDLGAESLDLVDIAIELESEFDLILNDAVVGEWRTVQDIIQTIEDGHDRAGER